MKNDRTIYQYTIVFRGKNKDSSDLAVKGGNLKAVLLFSLLIVLDL
jgi:hypothetical protein